MDTRNLPHFQAAREAKVNKDSKEVTACLEAELQRLNSNLKTGQVRVLFVCMHDSLCTGIVLRALAVKL